LRFHFPVTAGDIAVGKMYKFQYTSTIAPTFLSKFDANFGIRVNRSSAMEAGKSRVGLF
jgi:hypothetical protein